MPLAPVPYESPPCINHCNSDTNQSRSGLLLYPFHFMFFAFTIFPSEGPQEVQIATKCDVIAYKH